ncbi:MAG: hypothetical protein JST01_24375 [Cyanobacteria bacterium SZAS TMP-1]|nr:hypothetical protein [Cyanobacteria bacterium SZAS TMP-1]
MSSPVTTERPSPQIHPELLPEAKAPGKGGKWAPLKRAFPVAVALFAAANLALSGALVPKKAGDEEKNARGGDFWTNPALIDLAVAKFKEANQNPAEHPRVVLLGSSLVMFPFWAMDAGINPKIADIAHYHQSMALSSSLNPGGPPVPVFNLASAGQMSSDSYLYVSEFLDGASKPDVVFLGVAPRDFGDANLTSPMATVSFKRIVNLQNLAKYRATFLPHFNEQAEFIANEICYFYGRRWRMQRESDRLIEKLDNVIASKCGVASGAMASAAAPAASAGGVQAPVARMAAPASEPGADITNRLTGAAYERWVSSLKEYRSRYKGIGDRDISVQMNCLERTLKLCQERGIKVVLVNLPLTRANLELMPDKFYARFGGELAAIAGKHKDAVTYFDLSMDKQFTDYDFWDTVHMNQLGGAKLLRAIVPALQKDLAK